MTERRAREEEAAPSSDTEHLEANGHLPSGVTWTKVLEVVVRSEDDDIFFLGLIQAVEEAGNGCLFHRAIQQRCARILLLVPELYSGKLLELVSASMPLRWRDWDRDIHALALAMHELDIVPLSEVEPEAIEWLWEPYIPRKKITLVRGRSRQWQDVSLARHCRRDYEGLCLT